MPKVPKGKVLAAVYLDKDLWEEFRRLAFMKHDGFRYLSYEVEQALRAWLALHRSPPGGREIQRNFSKVSSKVNPTPKVLRAFEQVKEYLAKKFNCPITEGSQVSRDHLIEAIANTRGTDPKTISKWLNLFEKFKLVKHIAGKVYEVV